MGWLGRQSLSFGYNSISAVTTEFDSPAFNFLYRVLTPNVIIVLISSAFYIFKLDRYVSDIWLISVYYLIVKGLFIGLFSRQLLMDLRKEALIWVCTVIVSWAVYEYFIKIRLNLLPEPNELKNEFWILIILYLYSIFNNSTDYTEYDKAEIRRKNYIQKNYLTNKRKYGDLIYKSTSNLLAETIIHSIIIYEGFNRPKPIRVVESLLHPFICKTVGPMQIFTNKKISESESLELGIAKIIESFNKATLNGKEQAKQISGIEFDPITNFSHRSYLVRCVASDYNKDDSYVENVETLNSEIIDMFYKSLSRDEIVYSWRYSLLT